MELDQKAYEETSHTLLLVNKSIIVDLLVDIRAQLSVIPVRLYCLGLGMRDVIQVIIKAKGAKNKILH